MTQENTFKVTTYQGNANPNSASHWNIKLNRKVGTSFSKERGVVLWCCWWELEPTPTQDSSLAVPKAFNSHRPPLQTCVQKEWQFMLTLITGIYPNYFKPETTQMPTGRWIHCDTLLQQNNSKPAKRKEPLTDTSTWVNLKIARLTERSQIPRLHSVGFYYSKTI